MVEKFQLYPELLKQTQEAAGVREIQVVLCNTCSTHMKRHCEFKDSLTPPVPRGRPRIPVTEVFHTQQRTLENLKLALHTIIYHLTLDVSGFAANVLLNETGCHFKNGAYNKHKVHVYIL